MSLSNEYRARLNAALDKVAKKYEKMSPEEFRAKLDAHRDGDIGVLLANTGVFSSVDFSPYRTDYKIVTLNPTNKYEGQDGELPYISALAA